jgi:hypothetical protein
MKLDDKLTVAVTDLVVTSVADARAVAEGRSATDVLRDMMGTATYVLLMNPRSLLFLESPAYIQDMFDAERRGDWNRWMEV